LALANSFQTNKANLPSWAPDWLTHYNFGPQIQDLDLWNVFSAAQLLSNTRNLPSADENLSLPKSALRLYAYDTGTVLRTGDVFYDGSSDKLRVATLGAWTNMVPSSSESGLWAFLRTVLCDTYPGIPPPFEPLDRLTFVPNRRVRLDANRIRHVFANAAEEQRNPLSVLDAYFPGWQKGLIDKVFFTHSIRLPPTFSIPSLVHPQERVPSTFHAFGLGPRHMCPGDKIVYFPTANMPFIVRPKAGDKDLGIIHSLIGACYLDDLMDGAVWQCGLSEISISLS
jgi:hypothetical protein